MLVHIFGKKLSPRIEGNPDITTPECVNQQLIVDRIQPLQDTAHQTYLASKLAYGRQAVWDSSGWLSSRVVGCRRGCSGRGHLRLRAAGH